MKKLWILFAVCLLCLLCACERSLQTDVVLFCKSFNAHDNMPEIREENVFQRNDTEYLLYSGDILLRLLTDECQGIHTVILTAKAPQIETLQKEAACAFDVLASPFADEVPQVFLHQIRSGDADVQQVETEHFVYLLYRSPDCVTVQQINRHWCALPSLPSIHSQEDQPSSAENASQLR